MNLQGDFEGLTLASILQLLCNDQKTGILTVTNGEDSSRVFFDQGTIVYATSHLKHSRLGFLMQNSGVISGQQLSKCLAYARDNKLHLGKVLVQKGYISEETLKKYNTKQVELILYDLLLWEKGKFEYKDDRLNLTNMIVTQLNPIKLILEASRRIDELSVLKKVIPSDKLVFKMSGKVHSKEEIKLNANEWRVLSLIDGTRSVRQVITESAYDEFAVYKIIFSVISSGLIEQKQEVVLVNGNEGNNLSGILTMFNDIFKAMEKNLSAEIGEKAMEIFKETQSGLPPDFQTILMDYRIENQKNSNLQVVETAIARLDTFPDNQKEFLIKGFVAYCSLILKKAGDILGKKPVNNILIDIEKVLDYINKYQSSSNDKDRIVTDLNALISQTRADFNLSAKNTKGKKSLFSLFSR
ncbi:DUF4388 domain-containing protein [Desulfobacter sp.]|uniref:DUF4388 domain-containing protein n=1 Tax=Desulfobacter sp. TaxID=2294 RepID=UPI000E95D365|nr:DUF4388 domain-containing protein [Desulfobacter sp.]HBT89297.1 hypothetical protein [Desulfobacter sp.]